MSIDALFAQLKHPNPHLREQALWELAEQDDKTTIPRLMEILDEEDVVFRRSAVKALGAIGAGAVPAIVAALLHSDNVTVRGSCAKALAQIAVNHPDITFPTEGLQGLKQALGDANPVVHIAAAMALGEIGVPALEALIEVLHTTDNPALAVSVVNAIAAIGDPRGAEVLSALTQDDTIDAYVRETAVSALSRIEQVNYFKSKSRP
ncbi:HEAT repeat domain-containing protein [Synechococcales cyanobacterium C]|uniref:HEAT repeat domain-containing protein n=1 Tax=Petrachloros mirabilis ULC683 TaxID=2781853 RepID=A0A8K1ZWB5_9CYAN|nr:HEAT repeat domain-containing protein [Petrachloros mirabilis]NCJ06078.1 HEAT repeat domain-containing protein [Petrachloros mirabilis ULC683]